MKSRLVFRNHLRRVATQDLLSLGVSIMMILGPGSADAVTDFLSWHDLVEKVRTNNEEIRASERRAVAASHRASASYSAFYPQVSASFSRTQVGSSSDSQTATGDYTLSLNLSENLFAGFNDEAAIKIAKTNLEAAEIDLQVAKAKVSYDLKAAVASLNYAQNYLNLSNSIIERRELNLRLVQLRYDGGRENKGSLLLSKAYLEEARLDHLDAEQNLITAGSELSKITGEPTSTAQNIRTQVPVNTPPERLSDDEFQKLVETSPRYKTALTTEALADAAVVQAKAGFFPAVNLTASALQTGPTWYPEQDRWTLGASLTLPLFNGGRDYYASKATAELLKASTLNRTTILKDQLTQMKTAYGNYLRASQRLHVDQSHLAAAELREKISRQKYNNGLSTFEDWDGIETELIKRQKNLILTERDRILNEASWEQIQGKGVFQ